MATPAVPAAIALVMGVWLGVWLAWPLGVAQVAAVTAWAVAVATYARSARSELVSWALLAAFAAAGVLLGASRGQAASDTPVLRWFHEQPDAQTGRVGPARLEGRLRADASATDYGAAIDLDVTRVGDHPEGGPDFGGVRLSIGGDLARTRMSSWRAGRLIRVSATLRPPPSYRNPGQADQREQRARRGTVLLGSVKSALLVDVIGGGGTIAELAAGTRARVRRAVDQSVGRHGRRSAAIVTAVLIGDRAGLMALDDDTISRLQDGGTYHVIAISGGNIAILAGVLLLLGRAAGWRPRHLSVGVIVALVGYAYLVGHDASVGRATAAAVVVLGAGLLDHRTPSLNVVAVVAIGVLVVSPLSLFDAGFLLTFGATLGIVLGVARLSDALLRVVTRWWDPAPRWVSAAAMLLAATLCAEAALMPVGAVLFGRVSVAGLALNFLAIPLMTVTQIAGMVAVALDGVSATGASLVGWVAHAAATGLVESTRLLDLFPWLAFRVPPPGWTALVVYYAALLTWLWPGTTGRTRAVSRWTLAVAAVWIASAPWRPAITGWPPDGGLRVTFLDVGQADATLVQGPGRVAILVDAGGARSARSDVGTRVVAPALWARGVRRLTVAALSHGDPDHAGGLGAVLRDFRPGEVWDGVPVPGHAALSALHDQADQRHIRWRQTTRGDRFRFGQMSVRVLHPPVPDWERLTVRNDDSVVLDIGFGGVGVLLPGDIGHAVEEAVVSSLPATPFRIVKVPHHGSAGSSSDGFVDALMPCVAVVSAGRANAFGHPAPEVVQRYRQAGAVVLETARDGAVTMETDGTDIQIWTESGRRLAYRAGQADCAPLK
ncbi:MAG: DNA internalization-related competence protein ComEC/Rec2 [Acidobacteria bacterium]|nr:DNA internalization-related competence protein ComEC/Rec2 [Acidobacteriota bacterium]